MDFNYLYSEHQRLLMLADEASSGSRGRAHTVAASQLAGRIGCMQRALGASAAGLWESLAVPAQRSLALPARHLQGHTA